jgi:hypothetical protein
MFNYIEFPSIRNISKDLDNMLQTQTSSVFSFKQTIIVYIEHFKCQWIIFMETFSNERMQLHSLIEIIKIMLRLFNNNHIDLAYDSNKIFKTIRNTVMGSQ